MFLRGDIGVGGREKKLAISLGLTNVLNNMMLVSLQENHWTFGEVKSDGSYRLRGGGSLFVKHLLKIKGKTSKGNRQLYLEAAM